MGTAAFVVSIAMASLAVLVIAGVCVRVWFRRRRHTVAGRLETELAGETTVRAPEPGAYRGSTVPGHPTIGNDGVIALTCHRLVFRTLTGTAIDVPVTDITGVRNGESAGASGRQLVVVETSGGEVEFLVDDGAAWIAGLAAAAPRVTGGGPSTRARRTSRSDRNGVVRKRGSKKIVSAVFTSIGLAFAVAAGITAAVTAESISGDHHTGGTVVDISDEGKGYYPVVEFTAPDGATIRFTGSVGSNPPACDVGEVVAVRYDPDDPQDAGIDSYWQTWSAATFLGVFAAPFLGGGSAFGALALRARRTARADQLEQ